MKEIKEHKAYELLKSKYERIAIDYVIMSTDKEYEGVETHKKAIIEAFHIIDERNNSDDDFATKLETEKMKAVLGSMEELLELPMNDYYDNRVKGNRVFSGPKPIPYWYAFLEPPYGVPYLKSDFEAFNKILFPNEKACEAYRWNDDFSDYFDAGKEWWGTGLWSVYDSITGVIVIIGASLTD